MSWCELQPICPGRDECADCAAYARLVIEPFADDEIVLSEPLAERLRAIGRKPTRRPDDSADATEWFESVVADAQRPRTMPPALRRRLRAIPSTTPAARRRRPPGWLADGRWGLAACALLTATLTLAAGDVSARFQTTTDAVERKVGEVVAQAEPSWSGMDWIEKSLVQPVGALGRAGLAEVRRGRLAAIDWFDEQIDEVLDDAQETGRTTWTWLLSSADQIGEQLLVWSDRWSDRLQASLDRFIDSDANTDSDSTDTNDTGAVPVTSPDEPGSLP
ncbi:MAG: hypothetical protein AAGE94_18675 [Acidobacteriota bacterium]